jgi:hypothetical protein
MRQDPKRKFIIGTLVLMVANKKKTRHATPLALILCQYAKLTVTSSTHTVQCFALFPHLNTHIQLPLAQFHVPDTVPQFKLD